jgi:hypothetical protein
VDVSSPAIWEPFFSDGLLPAICIPAGTSGSAIAFADYCFTNDDPCTPGCRVSASAHSLVPSFVDAGSWGTAPAITLEFLLDASFSAPLDGEVVFVPFSCTAAVTESDAPGSFAISFAADGTPTVVPQVPDLLGADVSNCGPITDVPSAAGDLIEGLVAGVSPRIETIGFAIEDFVRPAPEPDRRALLGVAILALAWRAGARPLRRDHARGSSSRPDRST